MSDPTNSGVLRFPLERTAAGGADGAGPARPRRKGSGRKVEREGSVQRDGRRWRAVLPWPGRPSERRRADTRADAKRLLAAMRAERERLHPGWGDGGPALVGRGRLRGEITAWAQSHQLQGRSVAEQTTRRYISVLEQVCSLPLISLEPPTLDVEAGIALLAAQARRSRAARAEAAALSEACAERSVGSLHGHDVTQDLLNQIGRFVNLRSTMRYEAELRASAELGRPPAVPPGNGTAAMAAWLVVQLAAWCRRLEPDDPRLSLSAKRAAPARRAKRTPVLSRAENDRIAEAAVGLMTEKPALRMTVLAFLYIRATGCRVQEGLGLQWSDVDEQASELAIEWQRRWSAAEDRIIEKELKSTSRRLPLTDSLCEILRAAAEEGAAERERYEKWSATSRQRAIHVVWPATDLVFPSKYGTTLQPTALNNVFQLVLERVALLLGRPQQVRRTARNFRQLWACLAKYAGVDDITAARAEGHSLEVHINQYLKADADFTESDRRKFNAIVPLQGLAG